MLNDKLERELAYVVKVDSVEPMVGYDSIELAHVGGWTCVVGKDEFKAGDLGVYFEIDSKVPELEPFCLNQAIVRYKYKIKTQRMARGGVPYFSQGLLMSISSFKFERELKEGEFLTQELGVTFYEAEDNARKDMVVKNAQFKIDKAMRYWESKHPIKSKIIFFRWAEMSRLKKKYMPKKKSKTSDWPAWVKKTDEERCLVGNTKIDTENGKIRIADIVNKKLNVRVWSYNEATKSVELKPIVSYQQFKQPEKLYKIQFHNYAKKNRKNSITCTSDHKFYTQRGYVCAKDLKTSDKIYTHDYVYSDEALEAIYGMLLGDSHIACDKRTNFNKAALRFTQGFKQLDYLKYKLKFLDTNSTITESVSGYCNNLVYKSSLPINLSLSNEITKNCIVNNKKKITKEWADKLTPISFAFWYLDDGRFRAKKVGGCEDIDISTCGFSLEENELLIGALNRYGIEAQLRFNDYIYLHINKDNSRKFLNLIDKYIPMCMRYKTFNEAIDEDYTPKIVKTMTVVELPIDDVCCVASKESRTYDIEVSDNHNFFANGVLTHNCQNMPQLFNANTRKNYPLYFVATEKIDGTSTTFTMRQKKDVKVKDGFFKKHYERKMYICSRNVVYNAPDKEERNYYKDTDGNVYIEMSEKYNIVKVLNDILDMNPTFEYITIQGETYGGTIQKRKYCEDHRLAVFNVIYKEKDGLEVRLNPIEMQKFLGKYPYSFYYSGAEDGVQPKILPTVPIVNKHFILRKTCEDMLAYAGGASEIDGQPREGIVFRSMDGKFSFKAVDNEFLLKYHN